MIELLMRGDYAAAPTNLPMVLLGVLLAFAFGQIIAWVYILTHAGLSYSKSFVNSLVVMPILVSLVMQVLNNNLVTAFSLMAIFAIVRFRNVLRDTFDTTYVLSVIVLGMGCGTQKFSTSIIGCLVVVSVLLLLWYTAFGSRHRYDLILNLHWARPLSELSYLQQLLTRHSLTSQCANQRSNESYDGTDLSYRVLLRDSNRAEDLLNELRGLQGVSRVTSLKAEEESEL